MSGEYALAEARRVVTGLDEAGRSTIVSDAPTTARLVSPGNVKCDLWRLGSLPASLTAGDGLEGGVFTAPAAGGLVYRLTCVPPDTEWDRSLGYRDANGPLPGSIDPADAGGIPGMHYTSTIDFVTVLSGELVAIFQTCETVLRPGDTLIQRGTVHAWSNRTDEPVTLLSVMISANS